MSADEKLNEIRITLDEIRNRLLVIERQMLAAAPRAMPSGDDGRLPAASPGVLDGPWGDPVVRKDPPRWRGPSFVGRRFSETSADYLESLAGFFDWQAKQDLAQGRIDRKGRPTAQYKQKDSAVARGWAERFKAGWTPEPAPPAAPEPEEPELDDDFGF